MTDSMVMEHPKIDPKTRTLLLVLRAALLMALGALEDYLDMPRTKERTHRGSCNWD